MLETKYIITCLTHIEVLCNVIYKSVYCVHFEDLKTVKDKREQQKRKENHGKN
jgi:hypothetical protein